MTLKRTLGTCYYPEHWSEETWAKDAARMAELGLTWVRVGEFAWSRLEPTPGDLRLEWLERAIDTLIAAGLKVVLGTPTATPPRWMLDKHPDMLAYDEEGRPRGFGSRRHYCFSHDGYRAESERITSILAARFGAKVSAWQTDNEYGCHDTIYSYSTPACHAFRAWLQTRYGDIDTLNTAWGNVFWSMEYASFDQIDLPNLTVTEPNPSHALDFRRFSSDQVARFNEGQVAAIRAHSNAPISHNYMGRTVEFDHWDTGRQMEIATWDSYPLGFLEDRLEESDDHKRTYARQGDPDFQALHHDLYRAIGRDGRWWVMEQQPGPVNWAPSNPAPLHGMVRFWTWEAFAHGAECVSYFRWRQAPFAQEQYHAGLLRPDSAPAPAFGEAQDVVKDLADMPDVEQAIAPVAIVFDYASAWAWAVQPQGMECDYFRLIFEVYRGLRKLGVSVDILPPDAKDLSTYKLVFVPGTITLSDNLKTALKGAGGSVVLGPRTNAKSEALSTPVPLPPAIPGLDVTVSHVETLRRDMPVHISGGGAVQYWREHLEGDADVVDCDGDGAPILVRTGPLHYLGGWPDPAYLKRIIMRLCAETGVATRVLPDGIRIRETGTTRFVFNHQPHEVIYNGRALPPAGVHWEAIEA